MRHGLRFANRDETIPPMTDVSRGERELARQMLARKADERDGGIAGETAATPRSLDAMQTLIAGDRVLSKMCEHLSRWFGPEGFDALLTRALNRRQPKYPILAIVLRTRNGNTRITEGYRGIITGVPEPRSELSTPTRPVELTSGESTALDALLRLGESSPKAIADASGLTLEEVARALDQLTDAHYVSALDLSGRMTYRAATQSLR